jgi:hypothetical protein
MPPSHARAPHSFGDLPADPSTDTKTPTTARILPRATHARIRSAAVAAVGGGRMTTTTTHRISAPGRQSRGEKRRIARSLQCARVLPCKTEAPGNRVEGGRMASCARAPLALHIVRTVRQLSCAPGESGRRAIFRGPTRRVAPRAQYERVKHGERWIKSARRARLDTTLSWRQSDHPLHNTCRPWPAHAMPLGCRARAWLGLAVAGGEGGYM